MAVCIETLRENAKAAAVLAERLPGHYKPTVGQCGDGRVVNGFGVIGASDGGVFRPEHFDAKQVTVAPAGGEYPDGVRIREVVDIDFGLVERRGYQRIDRCA